jgi:hypothetical protein
MRNLKIYEEASGQENNISKLEIFFIQNLSMAVQENPSRIMRVRRSKKDIFIV